MEARHAHPDDAAAVAMVDAESWSVAYADLMPAEFLQGRASGATARWERTLLHEKSKGRRTGVVVDTGNSIVGYATVGKNLDDTYLTLGLLYDLYIAPKAWGSGAGARLMEWSLKVLQELGYTEAILWVLDQNGRARRFYERAGWRPNGLQRPVDYGGTELTAVCYQTKLMVGRVP